MHLCLVCLPASLAGEGGVDCLLPSSTEMKQESPAVLSEVSWPRLKQASCLPATASRLLWAPAQDPKDKISMPGLMAKML